MQLLCPKLSWRDGEASSLPGTMTKGGAVIGWLAPETRNDWEFAPQAIVKRPPAFFVALGISFRTGLDDLNEYQVAELVLDGGLPFALMRHHGTRPDETEICLPDSVRIEDVPHELGRILKELDLPEAAVAWRRFAVTPA
jgi:hypothetical protein